MELFTPVRASVWALSNFPMVCTYKISCGSMPDFVAPVLVALCAYFSESTYGLHLQDLVWFGPGFPVSLVPVAHCAPSSELSQDSWVVRSQLTWSRLGGCTVRFLLRWSVQLVGC